MARLRSSCVSSVIAFEANPELHKKISYLVQMINNATSRIKVRGFCNAGELNALGQMLNGAFLIVDIEGYEKRNVKSANHTDLAEVHYLGGDS